MSPDVIDRTAIMQLASELEASNLDAAAVKGRIKGILEFLIDEHERQDRHIDEQAREIEKLRSELTGCSPGMAKFIATPLENKIIWHDIDLERANEQIKKLQTALIEAKATDLVVHPDRWQKLSEEEKAGYRQDAEEILRAEMPEEMR